MKKISLTVISLMSFAFAFTQTTSKPATVQVTPKTAVAISAQPSAQTVTKPATTTVTPAFTGKLYVSKQVTYVYTVKDATGKIVPDGVWRGNYTTGNTDSAALADFKKAKGYTVK